MKSRDVTTSPQTGAVIKVLPQRRAEDWTDSLLEPIKPLRKGHPSLSKSVHRMEKEASAILIITPDKDTTNEDYRPLSLMNTVTKIPNKIRVNQI